MGWLLHHCDLYLDKNCFTDIMLYEEECFCEDPACEVTVPVLHDTYSYMLQNVFLQLLAGIVYCLLHYFFTLVILQACYLISIVVTISIAINFPQHLTPLEIWN